MKKKTNIALLIAFMAVLVLIAFTHKSTREYAIVRDYQEILKQVENLPKDFDKRVYSENLQDIKVISKDLDALKKQGVREVKYEGEYSTLSITLDDQGELQCDIKRNDIVWEPETPETHLSLYKKGKDLLILGTKKDSRFLISENLTKTYVTDEYEDDVPYEYESIDLLGADTVGYGHSDDYPENYYEEAYTHEKNFTLVREGNSFKFYHYGEMVKEVKFDGEIVNWPLHNKYILDSKNNLYYFYYTAGDPDIRFEKIASTISSVETIYFVYEPTRYSTYSEATYIFPMYEKNGKNYVVCPDMYWEVSYSVDTDVRADAFDEIIKSDFRSKTYCLDEAAVKYYQFKDELALNNKPYLLEYNIFEDNCIIEREIELEYNDSLDKYENYQILQDLDPILNQEEAKKLLNN